MRIAIHENKEIFNHSTSWNREWISFCQKNHIVYGLVNCFDNNFLGTINNYDALLWHFGGYSLQEMLFARSILSVVKDAGVRVFPDYNTSWHFDDKVAETYLLQSAGAPIPKSWVFYTEKSAEVFFERECVYPIVAKLRCGSGSSNVKLLRNRQQALAYSRRMFGRGFKVTPSILYKTKSNIKSAKNWGMVVNRMKRIPDFAESLRKSRRFPREKGYVFVQEFIPNDGYDLKVVVVGDKLSFVARDVRKGDFRASGGGLLNYDKGLITGEIRKISFDLSDRLGFQSMGYDFVVDNRDNSPKIVEISYGFSYSAQMDLGGYWDSRGIWYDKPLNAPWEVVENILQSQRTTR